MAELLSPRGAAPAVRRRATASLFVTAAAMNAAMALASPVATIVAADALGTAWGGVPNTAAVVGTGVGALAISAAAQRRGWRAGLAGACTCAAVGGLVASVAAATGAVALLVAGMALLGLGNAAAMLSRYVAAELHPPQRRGVVIGWVVWSAAAGAVGGPLLLGSLASAAGVVGLAAATGPLLAAAGAAAIAGATVRTLPADRRALPTAAHRSVPELLAEPAARTSLVVMATAQVVMVAIMTAAPLEMHQHHRGLGSVGVALAAHTLGMFALSPLTGWVLDRRGSAPVMAAGLVTLAASAVLVAATRPDRTVLWAAALFLLGYGWNLAFVGGSAHLAGDLPPEERARLEGTVDAAVWGFAALASLGSLAMLAGGGYTLVAAASLALLAPAAIVLWTSGHRSRRVIAT